MRGRQQRGDRRGARLIGALLVVSAVATVAGAASSVAASPRPAGARQRVLPPAPEWKGKAGAIPARPASCPKLTKATTASGTRHLAGDTQSLMGQPLWPTPPAGSDPERYAAEDHTPRTSPPTRPLNWDNGGSNWKLTSGRTPTASVSSNPQELCGVEGNSMDTAWPTTTGSPDTVIAVLDSGIDWCQPAIVDKIELNRAALPLPEDAGGQTKPQLESGGQTFTDADPYDLTDAGVLDVSQYAADPRVAAVAADYHGLFCASHDDNSYAGISPEDLIRTFGRPTLPGGAANPYFLGHVGPAGYSEAIAGWNALDDTNDPYDDVAYGHGTGEALDMAGSANSLNSEVGGCPDCRILPVRVGTSFIATGNAFANGVLFAVDSGATSISEALGATDQTASADQAIAYATAHGVPIVGSAADEESEHPNLPAAASNEIINVNSTTNQTSWTPASYLYLNGCTNYGPTIAVTVESASCSSEATGKTSGAVGLAETAAADAVAAGKITDYPGLRSATGKAVPLSANEIRQLVTMSADDIDFATAAPNAKPPAPADNYAVNAPSVTAATTTRYPTGPGWDEYTGWGRLDAARMVQWIAEGRIPPEAQITNPESLRTFSPKGTLVVKGMVAAVRSTSYRYQVDVAAGVDPSPGSWHLVREGAGTHRLTGVLARIPLAAVAALFTGGAGALTGGPVTKGGSPAPDKFTFTVRVVVEDAHGLIGTSQTADFLHRDPTLAAGFPRWFASSIDAPVRFAPIGPGGEDVMLVAESGGTIHALLPDGRELPGWPVHTDLVPAHLGEHAYTSGAITARPRGEILGGLAVGDLADESGHQLDVVATDMTGRIYAWDAAGKLLPGWPVRSDPSYSSGAARDRDNRSLPGFLAAPALGPLTGGPGLDVVASGLDRHVYAFDAAGRAVPGWPVLVVDPTEVQSIDPRTNKVTFLPDSEVEQGSELVDTPAIGSLDGHGPPDVIVGASEEYGGTVNADLGLLGQLLGGSGGVSGGNAREYAIWPDGSLHAAAPGAPDPPGMPDPGAFLPGWPVHVGDLDPGLLPLIGDGVTASPALADLGGDGRLEVVTSSTVGPVYEWAPDGSSYLGTGNGGLPTVASFFGSGPNSGLLDASVPALGDPVVAPVGAKGSALDIVDPAGSLGKLLDEQAPARQTPNDNQITVYSAKSGDIARGFPALMNDVQFLNSPIVADVAGSTKGSYVVEGSGVYDLRAYTAGGSEAPGFPKFTGGWTIGGAGVGAWGDRTDQVLAVGTRAGELLVWSTPTGVCAGAGPWPQVHHDLWNTSDLSTTGTPEYRCKP